MLQDNDGFHEPLFDEYQKLQAEHFWFVYRRKLIVWALQRYFPRLQSFLEIGCGTAENLAAIADRFPHAEVCGGEPSLHALQMARRHCTAKFLQMDARAIPFVEAFDVVSAFDVIEHIDDDRLALSEMYKSCRRGGGLILTVPQHPSLWSRVDDAAKHKRRYTRKDLVEKLRATGFRPLYVNSFMSLLLPVMVISRVHQKIARTDLEVDEGFRIGKTLNRLFSTVCDVEYRLLTRSLPFPAGGSLLAVAVKE
ncbi:MAG: class I SAM-dependent methyltransferase [Janthinobacterium lividum]